jgi:hypothetical protein
MFAVLVPQGALEQISHAAHKLGQALVAGAIELLDQGDDVVKLEIRFTVGNDELVFQTRRQVKGILGIGTVGINLGEDETV